MPFLILQTHTTMIPSCLIFFLRSLVQIKSHAQKVMKRMVAGENVFHRLEENCARLQFLVSEIHARFGLDPVQSVLSSSLHPSARHVSTNIPTIALHQRGSTVNKRRRLSSTTTNLVSVDDITSNQNQSSEGTAHILAASALCQLASPNETFFSTFRICESDHVRSDLDKSSNFPMAR
jgi:hypothetical protein